MDDTADRDEHIEIEELPGQLVGGREEDGQFRKGGVKLTSERASEIATWRHAKARNEIAGVHSAKASELAAAVLASMPDLVSEEATKARRMLVLQACDVAIGGRGQSRLNSIASLSREIGAAFAEASKVEVGRKCPRCGEVYGLKVPQVVVKGKALTKTMAKMIGVWLSEEGCPSQWVEAAERLVVRIGCSTSGSDAADLADS